MTNDTEAKRGPESPVTFRSDGLAIQGMWRDGAANVAAVILHPHPQYGGDMDNHVVMSIASACAAAGLATLRFNFRGTGLSEGAFAGGAGEADDARAAIAFAKERHTGSRVLLAGYSFGGAIAASVADEMLAGIVLVSPPAGMMRVSVPSGVSALVMTGDRDPIAPAEAVKSLAATNVDVHVVPGVDHGWWPGIEEIEEAVTAFARKAANVPPAE